MKKINLYQQKKGLIVLFLVVALVLVAVIYQNFYTTKEKSPTALTINPGQEISETKFYAIPQEHKGYNDLFFFFSPDGEKMAYAAAKDKGWTIYVNGQGGQAYDSLANVLFSPDSLHIAYTAKKDGKELIVIDGQESQAFDWTFEPKLFTSDSRFFIYKARKDGKDILMVNDWQSRPYDVIYKVTPKTDNSAVVAWARDGRDVWKISVDLDETKALK